MNGLELETIYLHSFLEVFHKDFSSLKHAIRSDELGEILTKRFIKNTDKLTLDMYNV